MAAALFWAATSLMTKRLTRSESTETVTLYLLLLLTPINAVLAVSSGGGFAIPGASGLALIVLAGVLLMVAQFFIVKAYASADAAYVQPFDHIKLPLNVLAGWIVFGFVPGGNLWFGSLLIVSASLYIAHRESRRSS